MYTKSSKNEQKGRTQSAVNSNVECKYCHRFGHVLNNCRILNEKNAGKLTSYSCIEHINVDLVAFVFDKGVASSQVNNKYFLFCSLLLCLIRMG